MKIDIKGPIVSNNDQWIYDWFGIEAVSPKKVLDQISKANNEDLEIYINSPGGSVRDASEIYTALKEYPGNVTGKIVGFAASAASFAAMGCNILMMAPTAQMMIHNAQNIAQGDYRDMDHNSNFLKNVNQTIANAYNLKSGKSYEELLSMMDNETWLTPQQALEHNLIDEIMFVGQETEIVASLGPGMLPKEVIEKVRNEINKIQPVATIVPTITKKEEGKVMDIEQLKNEHPELYKQLVNQGKEDGIKAENARIKAIEENALPGFEDLVNKAKMDPNATAETLAMEIIKAQKEQGNTFLTNRLEDANTLNQIQSGGLPMDEDKDKKETENAVNNMTEHIKKMRGGK